MAYSVSNIVAGRNSVLYRKAYSDTNDFPTAAAYGVAWTGYTDIGATQEGTEIEVTTETNDIFIDQSLDPVLTIFASRDSRLRTNLAEFTPENLLAASGQGSIATTAAGSGTLGHKTWTLDDTLTFTYYTYGVEAENPGDDEAIQWLVYRALAAGSLTSRIGVADDNAKIPIEVRALAGHPDGILAIRDIIPALA